MSGTVIPFPGCEPTEQLEPTPAMERRHSAWMRRQRQILAKAKRSNPPEPPEAA